MEGSQRAIVAPVGEVGIADLWRSIVRRRVWVLGTILAAVGAGVLFLALVKPVYQARAMILVGHVAGTGAVEPVEQLVLRLEAQYGQRVADGVNRKWPFLERAAPLKALPNGVELIAAAHTPDEAVDLLSGIVAEVQESHKELFTRNMGALTDRLIAIDVQLKGLEEQYQDASSILGNLKDKDPVQASLISLDRGRIATQIGNLKEERPELSQKLGRPQTYPTQLVNEITAPAVASFPKRSSILALAGVLGLMAGVLLAIVIEYAGTATGPTRSEHYMH